MSTRSKGGGGLSAARLQAAKALRLVQERGAYASAAIESQIEDSDLSEADKRFASALTLGVVRTEGALDAILDGFLDKPGRVRPDTRRGLQIAAYELLFMDREPQHAVDQGVRLVGKSAPYARGLANAVLRRVSDLQRSFPLSDPESSLEALCTQEGFPYPLAALIAEDRSEPFARSLIRASSMRPPVFLHINSLKAEAEDAAQRLTEALIPFEPIPGIPGCIRLGKPSDVARAPVRSLIRNGTLIVSDLAAQLVAFACVRDGLPQSFLEVGAGRGTKTVLIQSMAFSLHGAQIPDYVCVDNVSFKRDVLLERAQACNVRVSQCLTADGRTLHEAFAGRQFAAVLVDAPCSGIGTLRRHPEIIWKVSEEDIAALAALQAEMLASAASLVAPEGCLIYSTCTITCAEDEDTVEGFLASEAGASFRWLSGFMTVMDGWGADSHFAAIMDRRS